MHIWYISIHYYVLRYTIYALSPRYEITCKEEDCSFAYIGGTCRTSNCRGKEHLRGLANKDKGSVLYSHSMDKHHRETKFRMNMIGNHKTTSERQVTDGVKKDIENRPLLNNKTGYRANQLLRLTTG